MAICQKNPLHFSSPPFLFIANHQQKQTSMQGLLISVGKFQRLDGVQETDWTLNKQKSKGQTT